LRECVECSEERSNLLKCCLDPGDKAFITLILPKHFSQPN
jgi:hypothetical protein